MNRLLYILLISAITIVGFSMYKQNDIGHITITFGEQTFETNLIVFAAAVFCFLFVILAINRSILFFKEAFIYIRNSRIKRLEEKARHSLSQGLIEYAEGRFERAEKILLQQVKYSDNALLVYLSAARAAQQLGAHERRDDYLQKAHLTAPDANIAIGLTKAELQLAHQQNEQALATLTQLNEASENHTYVLTLLANTYHHLKDWAELEQLLPDLKKYGKLSEEKFLSMEKDVCLGQLSSIANTAASTHSGSQALIDYWESTASHLKALPEITAEYTKQLIRINASGEAESVLRQFIDKNWDESSIELYSELDVLVDNSQLETVEGWLKDHQQNAYLLLALGKMCTSRSLWGKAKSYLEASIAIKPMPESYLKLARLMEEHMNEKEEAQEYYRQGLHLLAGDYGDDALTKNAHDFERETPQLKVVKT